MSGINQFDVTVAGCSVSLPVNKRQTVSLVFGVHTVRHLLESKIQALLAHMSISSLQVVHYAFLSVAPLQNHFLSQPVFVT